MTAEPKRMTEKFTLLFVDDEKDILDSLWRAFRRDFNVITAESGEKGIEIIKSQPVNLIISDQRMPDITGDQVLAVARDEQPDAIRILLTGYSDIEALANCVNEAAIYKYITKPWEPEMLRLTVVRALEALALDRMLKETSAELEQAYEDAITMLSVACEGKDEDTGFHVQRVQHYTEALALELGVEAKAAKHMGLMSILHDVGKLFVPDAILQKPAKLDDDEWVVMRQHPDHGVRILGDNPFYKVAREIAGGHHENFDGSGYPKGLKAEDIPMSARIAKVADVFDALSSKRPYKEPWPMDRILGLLGEESGRQFDPTVIEAFMRLEKGGKIAEIMTTYHAHDDPDVQE
ncbi:HD-GYP domain-containing protein [Kordiimonas marina]|uniref:HD-GYP domain-containing protein n=1 Tax=Kordiimonas marina TaxID=2872312 RepID=UPI001FF5C452|nr:HD domain-containing phosphohydrolase [Kordiimonas marina]MCJ9429618.1 response regulator [Kordiimonas marina]